MCYFSLLSQQGSTRRDQKLVFFLSVKCFSEHTEEASVGAAVEVKWDDTAVGTGKTSHTGEEDW